MLAALQRFTVICPEAQCCCSCTVCLWMPQMQTHGCWTGAWIWPILRQPFLTRTIFSNTTGALGPSRCQLFHSLQADRAKLTLPWHLPRSLTLLAECTRLDCDLKYDRLIVSIGSAITCQMDARSSHSMPVFTREVAEPASLDGWLCITVSKHTMTVCT